MKKIWLIAIMLMVLSLNLFAIDVIIGTGTSNGIDPFNGYGRSAALYTAEEIGITGEITHLSWYVGFESITSVPIKIYAKMVADESLTEANWTTLTNGATLVYEGNGTFSSTGWATIDITDFDYTGDNLLILCEANYGGGGAGSGNFPLFRYSSATGKHLSANTDNSPPEGNLNANASRPNIKITLESPIISSFPYTDSFEIGNTHGSTDVMYWTQETVGSTTKYWTVNSTETTYNRTPRTGLFDVTLQFSANAWLFRPVQLVAGTSYSVEVYGRQDGAVGANASITLKYGESATAEAMTGSIVDLTPVVNGDYQRLRGAFIPETSGLYYIGILGTINGSPYYITIDDFMIEETPAIAPNPAVLVSPADEAENVPVFATLSWLPAAEGGDPTAYELYVGITDLPTIMIVDQAGTSYTFETALQPLTEYFWKVVPKNVSGSAVDCPVWSFTTAESPIISSFPYTDSFEIGNTHNSTNIQHWSQAFKTGSTYVEKWTVNSTETSYNRTPRTGDYNVTLQYNGESWMFRPVQLTEGTSYRVELYARLDASSGAQITIAYGATDTEAAMTNTIISTTQIVSGNYQRLYGTFEVEETGLYYVGILGETTNTLWYLSIDDFMIDEIPNVAPSPAVLVSPADEALNVPIFATLSWAPAAEGGDPTAYELYVGTTELPASPTADLTERRYTYTTPLEYDTKYIWKVVPKNATGSAVDCPVWSFKTMEDPTVTTYPFTEGFEGTQFPPLGWSQISVTGLKPWIRNTYTTHSGTASAQGQYQSPSSEHLLITPPLDLGTNNYRLRFWLYGTSLTATKLKVQIAENNALEGSFVKDLAEYVGGSTMSSSWARKEIDLTGYAGVQYIAFRIVDQNGMNIYIDDIVIEEAPNPAVLVSPADAALNVPVFATLSWAPAAEGGDPTGYELYVGTTELPALPTADLTETSYTFTTPLEYGTDYIWQVVPKNASGSAVNCPVWSFKTMEDPTVTTYPFTEGFEGTQFPPLGWSQISVTGSKPWIRNTSTKHSGNASAQTQYEGQESEDLLITPPLDLGTNNYRLRFWLYECYSEATKLKVQIADNNALECSFVTDLAEYVGSSSMSYEWTRKEINLTGYEGVQYIAFRIESEYGECIYIDDIVIEEIPTAPIFVVDPTEYYFAGIAMGQSSSEQTFTITNTGVGELSILPVRITGENADQFVLINANEYPIELEGDETATVKVKFSPTLEGNLAANLEIAYFDETDQTANVTLTGYGIDSIIHIFPYTETFETYETVPPLLWTTAKGLLEEFSNLTVPGGHWTGSEWFTNATDHINRKGARFGYYYDQGMDWLITPTIDLDDNVPGGYKLEFDLALTKTNSASQPDVTGDDDRFAVIISTDNGETWSSSNALRLWDNTDSEYIYNEISMTGERIVINLIGYSGEVKIGFYGESTIYNSDNDIHLDNVTITYDATLPVELSAFNTAILANNTVAINWTTQSESSLMGYHILRSNDDQLNNSMRITYDMVHATNTSTVTNYFYNDQDVVHDNTYYYWLQSVEMNGTYEMYGPIVATVNQAGDDLPDLIYETAFKSIYPNPFNPNTTLSFSLAEKSDVNIKIFNVKGQLVKNFTEHTLNKGVYNITWNGKDSHNKDCASGIYLFRLQAGKTVIMKKGMLVK